jgi:hypothetical protein
MSISGLVLEVGYGWAHTFDSILKMRAMKIGTFNINQNAELNILFILNKLIVENLNFRIGNSYHLPTIAVVLIIAE